MLLILEIGLTVAAWRKGWRAWALVPLGGVLGMGFLIGVAVGASGGTIEHVFPLVLLLDLACVGVLIRLAVRGPRQAESLGTPETSETAVSARM